MPVGTEIARLRRSVEDLVKGVDADIKTRSRLSDHDRQSLKTEIESCMQALDELRSRLAR